MGSGATSFKEDLAILHRIGITPGGQRHDVVHRLHRFNSRCAQSGLPALHRLAATIQARRPEVLAFLQTGVTNAGTGATNRTVKAAALTAYGFRNLDWTAPPPELAAAARAET